MWGDVDPDELSRVWGEELSRFSGDDLAAAVKAMPAAYPDYPPTLPQFAGLCNDARRNRAGAAVKLSGPRGELPPLYLREAISKILGRAVFKGRARED